MSSLFANLPPILAEETSSMLYNLWEDKELTKTEVVLGVLLSGINKANSNVLRLILKCSNPVLTDRDWNNILPKITEALRALVEKSVEQAILYELMATNKYQEKTLSVMSDCCWNVRGFNSPLGAVSMLGMTTKLVIAVEVMINRGMCKNTDVPSKAFEGEGTERICERLAKQGLKIEQFLHDGDSSSYASVKKIFENCKELRCINHAAKNFNKFCCETFGSRYSKTNSKRFYNGFWNACRNSSYAADPNAALVKNIENMVNHYGGEHSACSHPQRPKTYQKADLTTDMLNKMLERLAPVIASPEKYSHGQNQSLAESFNKEICDFAPKNVCVPILYEARCLLAVLKHNYGASYLEVVYSALGLQMSKDLHIHLQKKERLSGQRFLNKVVSRDIKPRKKRKLQKHTEHTYKEEILEDTICGCKSGCKTNMCRCRKNFNSCNPLCKCNSNCTNKESLEYIKERIIIERTVTTLPIPPVPPPAETDQHPWPMLNE